MEVCRRRYLTSLSSVRFLPLTPRCCCIFTRYQVQAKDRVMLELDARIQIMEANDADKENTIVGQLAMIRKLETVVKNLESEISAMSEAGFLKSCVICTDSYHSIYVL